MPSPTLETFEERYMQITDAKAQEKLKRRQARRAAQLQRQKRLQYEIGAEEGECPSDEEEDDDDQYIVYGDETPGDVPPTVLYAKVAIAPPCARA